MPPENNKKESKTSPSPLPEDLMETDSEGNLTVVEQMQALSAEQLKSKIDHLLLSLAQARKEKVALQHELQTTLNRNNALVAVTSTVSSSFNSLPSSSSPHDTTNIIPHQNQGMYQPIVKRLPFSYNTVPLPPENVVPHSSQIHPFTFSMPTFVAPTYSMPPCPTKLMPSNPLQSSSPQTIPVTSFSSTHPVKPPIPSNQSPPNPFTQTYHQVRKLQDLPDFSGQPEQWPMFSVSYRETTLAYGYTDLENLTRLQKALKGVAKQRVESLLIHSSSVNAIMLELENSFGRPDVLVRSQVAKAKSFPNISETRIIDIVNFSTIVSNLTVFLENSGAVPYLYDRSLLDELVSKLPLSKREDWAKHTFSIGLYPSVREFSIWLKQIAAYIAIATEVKAESIDKKVKHVNAICPVGNEHQKPIVLCLVCHQNHHLYKCQKFKDATVPERWQIVKNNRVCFCCLRSGHSVAKCSFRRECGISACHKCHNRLLHDTQGQAKQMSNTSDKSSVNRAAVAPVVSASHSLSKEVPVGTIYNKDNEKKTLFKFIPVCLSGPKGTCNIMAFIDDGAKISLIEENVVNSIGIKGQSDLLSLRWIGDTTTSEISQHVDLEISGLYNNASKHHMKNVRTTKQLLLPAQTLIMKQFYDDFVELNGIPVSDYSNAMPQMLIGIPHTNVVRPLKVVNFAEGFSVHKTKLGWTLFGSNEECTADATVSFIEPEEIALQDLQKQVAEYFALESVIQPAKTIQSEADKRAEKILKETTAKINGQYETGLLWKDDSMKIPHDSYSMALKRLQTTEKKMEKDPNLAEWYRAKIREYVSKNYARKLTPKEASVSNPRSWYLPHFSVCNINKGNKLRLVFDAAASINGTSLNSMLMKGPDAYQPKPLLSILLKFRQKPIGVCADIREMFHRINIRKEDQDAQRFLWRDADQQRPPDTYVMNAMIFGSTSSPCSAQFVKNLNANEFKNIYPEAVKAIIESHYVDDYVDCFHSVGEAISISKQVIEIHSKGGFELRGFVSNSSEYLKSIDSFTNSVPPLNLKDICNSETSTEKILGMHWDSNTDEFCFVLKFGKMPQSILEGKAIPTKSQVLSITMSIFDPFGFLANIVIKSKLLLQELWRVNVNWNEPIPEDTYRRWYQWYKSLDDVKRFRVPRCYSPTIMDSNADVQLHVFVDASEVAYSAVGYWRISYGGQVDIVFVMGKTRCSPMKTLSIPRLELQAALLGVRLKNTILNGHDFQPSKIIYWSDSKTVIHWIRSDSRTYKQFVAHRISEILEDSDVKDWRWVPGTLNPADDATRPNEKASIDTAWMKGPNFLEYDEEQWPEQPNNIGSNDISEKRSKFVSTIYSEETAIPYERYSCYYKFLRIMCWVRRGINGFKNILNKVDKSELKSPNTPISVKEIKSFEKLICRIVQEEAFPNEMRDLLSKKNVSAGSSIFKLTPVLDEDNVIRLGGRIDNATCLPIEARRPIILPNPHKFSTMITKHYHEIFYHHNQDAIVCAIRSKFWIPNIRQMVKQSKKKCQLCKNLAAVPRTPQMGQLPVDRLTAYVRPFTYTGIDYFGPIQITIGRRQEKRWVALFTCLSVRAVHLELAKDLSTDAVILCLRNFVNRRGVPVRLRSDCGTNFIGATKKEWILTETGLQSECTQRGIEWVFNTPGNPSAGGAWERMVRCVKKVLSFTLKEKAPQIETLQSLLIEAENLVNSRPLTHLPIESEAAEPLTPNHFLLGCPNYVQTPQVGSGTHLRKQWHILQQLKQTFWKRWVLEYLPTLARRTKWYKLTEPLQVGNIVVVCDENESRGQWKRGKIIKVFPSPDSQVRSALVKTSSGTIKRPVSKLAKLDVEGESS